MGGYKLTREEVLRIRATTLPTQVVADFFGVGVRHVNRIRRRETWRWLRDAEDTA